MGKFQLTLATQLGEKVAVEAGFSALPVDPKVVAAASEIEVIAKPPDMPGVSGVMIFSQDGSAALIYSTALGNQGHENFSIAHELGHYFLPGHPEEIIAGGGTHVSRSNFTQNTSIELEADHFAAGLLLPTKPTKAFLSNQQVGLEGIMRLAELARCSVTAAAIRAAECAPYPVAVVVSEGEKIAYCFMTESFKRLGKLSWLKKGDDLPGTTTRRFNAEPENIMGARQVHGSTDLNTWFDGPSKYRLDEEVLGLGGYGYTLTVLSGESLPDDPDDDEDEEADLVEQWKPKFAYGR